MSEMDDSRVINRLIKIGFLVLMVTLSVVILAPFMIMLIWGVIISVALFPFYVKSVKVLGNKKSLTAVLFALTGLAVIIIPSILLTTSSATEFQSLQNKYESGELRIPVPSEDVKEWPVIGEKLYASWDLASHNLSEFVSQNREQIKNVVSWFFGTIAGVGLTILQFIGSIIIAVVLLSKADSGEETAIKVTRRLVGEKAEEFIKLTVGTIRSVVQGILGIAFIQAFAAGLLMVIFDVPVAGLWAMIILILAIMQLPPLLILAPVIAFIFQTHDTIPATIFTVFAIIISMSDSFLKPLFLGRGVDIPMLVVLLGAIGGMLVFGILGLFVGAVILALSYKLMMAWMHDAA